MMLLGQEVTSSDEATYRARCARGVVSVSFATRLLYVDFAPEDCLDRIAAQRDELERADHTVNGILAVVMGGYDLVWNWWRPGYDVAAEYEARRATREEPTGREESGDGSE